MTTNTVTAVVPATATSEVRAPGSERLRYSHEAMIDLIIQDPTVTARELAELFSYSEPWVRRILASDSFSARLAARKAELVDPGIARAVTERFRGLAVQASEILADKLEAEQSASFALDVLSIASSALATSQRAMKKDV